MIVIKNKIIVFGMSFMWIYNLVGMEENSISPTRSLLDSGWGFVATNVSSAITTVTNQFSDEAAFAKLGWPTVVNANKVELQKGLDVQLRHKADILSGKYGGVDFNSDSAYISRRQAYIKRVIDVLPIHPQASDLAFFCLKNYQQIMNSFDIARMVVFVQTKKQSSEKEAQVLNDELTEVIGSLNSVDLRSVLQNSGLLDDVILEKPESDKEKENKQGDKG